MAKWLSLEHIKQWLLKVEPVSWHSGHTFLLDVGSIIGTLLVKAGHSVLSFFWFAFKSFTVLVRAAHLLVITAQWLPNHFLVFFPFYLCEKILN